MYFQPPATVKMSYPCITYDLMDIDEKYANNGAYLSKEKYKITLIDEDPESEFISKVKSLPLCSFDRGFIANNMNHWVFILYF